MIELNVSMPKSADSDTKNAKTVQTVHLRECSFKPTLGPRHELFLCVAKQYKTISISNNNIMIQ